VNILKKSYETDVIYIDRILRYIEDIKNGLIHFKIKSIKDLVAD